MKYIVLFAAFDNKRNFSEREINKGEGCWGVSSNGKKPTEYEFFACRDRKNAIAMKNLFKEYSDSFWKLLKGIQKTGTYSSADHLEVISQMTNFPD